MRFRKCVNAVSDLLGINPPVAKLGKNACPYHHGSHRT